MKFKLSNILFLSVLLFSVMFFAGQVSALTVSPVRLEISGDAGATIQGNIVLINEQSQPQKLYSSFANFEARGESGDPYFVPATSGLGTWITVPTEVDLKSGEQKTLPYSIKIPKDAEPGGYYGAIFWGNTPTTSQAGNQQVSISGRLGILVLLTVNGQMKYGGGLLSFNTINNQKLFGSIPVDFEYRFSNAGSDRINLQGNITIKNMFGQTTATVNANSDNGNILPGTVRKFSASWQDASSTSVVVGYFQMAGSELNNFNIGRYVAELKLNYGSSSPAIMSYSFFVFPWQLLSLVLISLIVLVFLLKVLLNKYNKWIIGKVMSQKNG
jgi:hypothetical protein